MKVGPRMQGLLIEPVGWPVRISVGTLLIAQSSKALMLRESGYPGVVYVPRSDADMRRLARSSHTSRCPLKGQAGYYSIWTDQGSIANAAWSYDMPHEAAAAIAGYIAFNTNKVEVMVDAGEQPSAGT